MGKHKPVIDNFKERYLELKAKHLTDVEISIQLYCSPSHVYKQKVKHGLVGLEAPRKNEQGVSEKEFEIAIKNGLSRRLVLQRVRRFGWTNRKAITSPRGNQRKGKKWK